MPPLCPQRDLNLARIARETHRFPNTGADFSALYAAEAWLKVHGYSYGSTQSDWPVGILRGHAWTIAKWRNLTTREREDLDGVILWENGGPRLGDAVVEIWEVTE